MGASPVLPVTITRSGTFVSGQTAAADTAGGVPFDFSALLDALRSAEAGTGAADPTSSQVLADLPPGLQQALAQRLQAHGASAATQPDLQPPSQANDVLSALEDWAAQAGLPGLNTPLSDQEEGAKEDQPDAASLGQWLAGQVAAAPQPPLRAAHETAATPGTQNIDLLHGSRPERPADVLAQATLRPETANLAAEERSSAKPAASDNFQNMLGAAQSAAAGNAAAPGHRTDSPPEIRPALHSAQWPEAFGERVVWMARQDSQTAQLSLNPPQLGPIHISLDLSGDQASAVFVSPHAEVRQAIEEALPRLREMLADTGIQLGNANVGAELPQQREAPPQFAAGSPRSTSENAILPDQLTPARQGGTMPLRHGRGLVDLFA